MDPGNDLERQHKLILMMKDTIAVSLASEILHLSDRLDSAGLVSHWTHILHDAKPGSEMLLFCILLHPFG